VKLASSKLNSFKVVGASYSRQLRESGAGVNCAHSCLVD
jgi:hypothetical protein